MAKDVRLSDIAQHVGVSTVTVSRALTSKKGMSEAMRAKIRETASAMGYEPLQNERQKSTGNVGILARQRYLNNTISMYWDFYRRLFGVLKETGYFGILELISTEDEKDLILPSLIQGEKADSLIIIGEVPREYWHFIASSAKELRKPLIFLDSDEARLDFPCVISDSYYGMYAMTRYLIDMGHRDIRFAGSIDTTNSILDRYYGYCRALREAGLEAPPPILDRDKWGETIITLPENLPTAFACNCDYTAAYLIRLLEERNLSVPGDISIVGYDDYVYPGLCPVPLTTWAIDMDAMARASIDLITREKGKIEPGAMVIGGRMIKRDSVRRLER